MVFPKKKFGIFRKIEKSGSGNQKHAQYRNEVSGAGSKVSLPIGLQIIGKPFEEEKIFEVARLFEPFANIH